MGVKASYSVGLKVSSGVVWPMLHEMSTQRHKVSSHPFSPPSLTCVYIKNNGFWKLAGRYKCARDIPNSTPSPLKWAWIAAYGVDHEIRRVIVNYSIGVPYIMFCFAYSLSRRNIN